jgi:hypothetical protein
MRWVKNYCVFRMKYISFLFSARLLSAQTFSDVIVLYFSVCVQVHSLCHAAHVCYSVSNGLWSCFCAVKRWVRALFTFIGGECKQTVRACSRVAYTCGEQFYNFWPFIKLLLGHHKQLVMDG